MNLKYPYWTVHIAALLTLTVVLPSSYYVIPSILTLLLLRDAGSYTLDLDDCVFHETDKTVGENYLDTQLLAKYKYNLVFCRNQQCIYELPNAFVDIYVSDGRITSCRTASKVL